MCESFPHDPLGLVLVRRGGYAVGLARGGRAHRAQVRHPVRAVAHGSRWLVPAAVRRGAAATRPTSWCARWQSTRCGSCRAGTAAGLVVGGDRTLVRDVLGDPRLAHLAELPRRELYDLPDPRLAVLREALRRGRAVWVDLDEPERASAGQ